VFRPVPKSNCVNAGGASAAKGTARAVLDPTGDFVMNLSTLAIDPKILRNSLAMTLAATVLTLMNASARAADLDPITVCPPAVTTLGRDMLTEAPVDDVIVNARIAVDTETLRNDSGVVLLKDRVQQAAEKACEAADRYAENDDGTCIRDAVKAAQPQVTAAIAKARSSSAS
jgi:UrcA family protein